MADEKSRLGESPLHSGALDWLDDDLVVQKREKVADEKIGAKTTQEEKIGGKPIGTEKEEEQERGEGENVVPTEPVYRRHTLIMQEEQIDLLDRMLAIDRLNKGTNAVSKKELVHHIFKTFFESEEGVKRLTV